MILAEGPETVAAFIGEPILGTGGIVPPPAGYWEKIQAVLKKYDVLLVADEVVTGFGRLGTMFGSDHYGMKPDLITIAKGLTSAYAPLSGVIVSDKMWKVLVEGSDKLGALGHGWTYSAHPICAAAGIANLELIDELDLVDERAAKPAPTSAPSWPRRSAATAMSARCAATACLAAVEFVADKDDRGVLRRLAEDRAASGGGARGTRRHRPRNAAGRHSRLRPAALPDQGRSRHRRCENR